jgi:hypothetical protein
MFSIASNTSVCLGIGKESVTSKPSKAFRYVPAISSALSLELWQVRLLAGRRSLLFLPWNRNPD